MKLKIQDSRCHYSRFKLKNSRFTNNQSLIFNLQSSMGTGFTLMELLVVIAIIGMLAGILMPTLNVARERGRRVVCIGNLKVIGEAFNMYNIDIGEMPPTPANNRATNRIKTTTEIVGMGYFYDDPNDLTNTKNDYIEDLAVFVCPSSDYLKDPKIIKQNWDTAPATNTYSAYLYRAGSGYLPPATPTLMLSDALPALVMDYNNATPPSGCTNCAGLNHKGEYVNILFKNGNVKGVENIEDTNDRPKKILTLAQSSVGELNRVSLNADKQQ